MVSNLRELIYQTLDEAGVAYERFKHEAVFTCEQADALKLPAGPAATKNAFLRDAKKQLYYLVTLASDERIDFKNFKEITGKRLSFASEEELRSLLGVDAGAVSPLCLLHPEASDVTFLVSKTVIAHSEWFVHPGINSETLSINSDQLLALLPADASPFSY